MRYSPNLLYHVSEGEKEPRIYAYFQDLCILNRIFYPEIIFLASKLVAVTHVIHFSKSERTPKTQVDQKARYIPIHAVIRNALSSHDGFILAVRLSKFFLKKKHDISIDPNFQLRKLAAVSCQV